MDSRLDEIVSWLVESLAKFSEFCKLWFSKLAFMI